MAVPMKVTAQMIGVRVSEDPLIRLTRLSIALSSSWLGKDRLACSASPSGLIAT